MAKNATIGYSKELKQIEITVPHGTKSADMAHVLTATLSKAILARLPRGCTTCTSGDHLLIREQLQEVINVDLEKV